MSVTTTQNPTTYTLAQTLAEYELHHSEGPEDSEQQTAPPNPRESAPSTENNPAGWEAEYRRVPPHRPTDTTLDFASRDITNNGIERFFITNMFQGIWIVSVSDSRQPAAQTKHLSDLAIANKPCLEGDWRQDQRHLLQVSHWRTVLGRFGSR